MTQNSELMGTSKVMMGPIMKRCLAPGYLAAQRSNVIAMIRKAT
jgi:hypothetical protein